MMIAIDFSTWDFSWVSWIGFRIITMFYFAAFGVLNIYYAVKTRKNPEKIDNPKFFINEVATGVLFFIFVLVYPFLWDSVTSNVWVKDQLYFHLWDTFTVQIIGWQIYMHFAQKNNIRKNRIQSYEDWKKIQLIKYNQIDPKSLKSDLKRKLQHLLPGGVILGFYYLAQIPKLESILLAINWSVMIGTLYFTAAAGITFAWMMNIFDLVRLMKWEKLGKFARTWADGAIHLSEFNTFTSAAPMVLAFIPFFLLPQKQFLFAVCLIAGLADAMACIVGKKWGRKRDPKTNKTLEGYIAGIVTTYLLVLLTNIIIPFEVSPLVLQIMAIVAAAGFFGVDYFGRYISDNILNSLVCGFSMYLVYLIAL
jgi:dolichol kinase